MKNTTLTRKFFLRIAPTILVTLIAIGYLAFSSANREINYVYDAQLITNANVLWTLLEDEFSEAGASTTKQIEDIDLNLGNQLELNEDADDYSDARMFRAWKLDKLVMLSSTAFSKNVPVLPAGFNDITYNNEHWRVYTLEIPNTNIKIEVGEKIMLRDKLTDNILMNLFYPLLLLIPLIGALLWFGINSGLGTIRTLVQQIHSRSPEDLSAIALDPLPRDLAPLGKSINQLLVKLGHSLTSERRFADHAAHQLRTPQAQIKLLLQMLASTDSEKERASIISDLEASNKNAIQLIEQLLRAARVSQQPITLQPLALYHAVASVVASLGTLADQKKIEMSLSGDEKAEVYTDETLLRLMISNLIDNAIKYTPENGTIRFSIAPASGNMWSLSITDTGPGIAIEEREAVFQRFYRVETPEVDGTGLGLAIVADIIERLSGTIALTTPENGVGLRVEVQFPKA